MTYITLLKLIFGYEKPRQVDLEPNKKAPKNVEIFKKNQITKFANTRVFAPKILDYIFLTQVASLYISTINFCMFKSFTFV